MDVSQIRERIGFLVSRSGEEVTPNEYGEVLHGTSTVLAFLYGPDSKQVVTFERAVAEEQKRLSTVWPERQRGGITQLAAGVLSSTLAELDSGLIGNLRQQVAGEVLADFVTLSRAATQQKGDGAKNVAAVLAAAAFEDAIRRLGAARAGTVGGEKLADVLLALKDAGVLEGAQVGIAQSYLKFRNDSMHADWKMIEREAVHSVLGFVEQLVLRHFR